MTVKKFNKPRIPTSEVLTRAFYSSEFNGLEHRERIVAMMHKFYAGIVEWAVRARVEGGWDQERIEEESMRYVDSLERLFYQLSQELPKFDPKLQRVHPSKLKFKPAKDWRFKDNPEEKRLFLAWKEQLQSYIGNSFFGTLLTKSQNPADVTQRDVDVSMHVIQWLGSPVGQGWLRDLGYVRKEGEP